MRIHAETQESIVSSTKRLACRARLVTSVPVAAALPIFCTHRFVPTLLKVSIFQPTEPFRVSILQCKDGAAEAPTMSEKNVLGTGLGRDCEHADGRLQLELFQQCDAF